MLEQLYWLFILSVVVSSISWTVTQEEIFREPRSYAKKRSEAADSLLEQKFFYVFTCEYCFSHWVTLLILLITGFQLLISDWRGYFLSFFAIPWVANQLMSIYRRLRIGIKHEDLQAKAVEEKLED
jgi:hypothetical protein